MQRQISVERFKPSFSSSWLLSFLAFLMAPALGFAAVLLTSLGENRPALLIALPCALALGLLLILRPTLLLVAILTVRAGLDPILEATKLPLGATSMGLGGVLNGLIIVLAIYEIKKNKHNSIKLRRSFLAPLLCVALVGLIKSPTPAESIKLVLNICTYFFVFALGYSISARDGTTSALKTVLNSSWPAIFLSAAAYFSGTQLSRTSTDGGEMIGSVGRFSGSFSHPNIMAFYFTVVVVVCIYFLSRTRDRTKLSLAGLTLVVSLAFILLSMTRSAWIAIAITALLYSLIFNRRAFILLLAGGLLTLSLPIVQERLSTLTDDRPYLIFSTLDSYSWRVALWKDALSYMAPETWAWGNGINSFFAESPRFFSISGGRPFGAHNVYLQLLYDTGLVGLLVMLAPLVSLLIMLTKGWAKNRQASFIGLASLVIYLTVCYSDNILGYLVYNLYFWFTLGAVTYATNTAPSDAELQ